MVYFNHVGVWLNKLKFQYCAIDGFLITDMFKIMEMNLFISSIVSLLQARGRNISKSMLATGMCNFVKGYFISKCWPY